MIRVAIVGALLLVGALAWAAIRLAVESRRRNTAPRREGSSLPSHITEGAERTWAVFTTPMCTTCDPVIELLRAAEPASRVVKIDATVERSLADSLGVRSAPTAVLAHCDGRVRMQLVGPAAVGDYLDGLL